MPVSFNQIPSNLRVPLFYAEVDGSQAGSFVNNNRALLIGYMLATGAADPGVPHLVTRTDQAKQLFGVGSVLARMVDFFKRGNDFTELWCVALSEPAAGVAQQHTLTVTGPATEAGTLSLYVAAQRLQIGVANGDTADAVATAIAAAINANTDLPVTAAAAGAVVTTTARHKGLLGADIDFRLNYHGSLAGETTPAGIAVAVAATVAAAGAPDIAVALDGIGDEPFEYVAHPFTDAATLDAFRDEFSSATGRWSYSQQIYGHVVSAEAGSVGALQTFGASRNDEHHSVVGFEDSPSPPWEWAAATLAAVAKSVDADPARPFQTLPLIGILPPPPQSCFIMTERQTLLSNGIATFTVAGGVVRIERLVTTYQKNAFAQPDASFLDSETLFTLSYVLRFLRQRITTKYARHKLANDGTRFGAGQAIVTPKTIRAELIAGYSEMEFSGVVENMDAFKANLVVERNANDPNRLDVLYPPDLVNQLRIFAVLAQFRLQYPTAQV